MDNRDLTLALREAAEDVEPRPNFAADVLRGGRRRRSRNRFTIGAAALGAAAVAVAAVTVLPSHLAAPPAADDPAEQYSLLNFAGGDLIDDETVTRSAVLSWESGVTGQAGESTGIPMDERRGEPHVYWAGTTPLGETAIVVQEIVEDVVLPAGQERTVLASGLVVNNPDDDRPDELELVAVQLGGAYFVLPDNRTVLGHTPSEAPGEELSLFVSPSITVDDNSRSTRDWTRLTDADGVEIGELPEDTNLRNVRMVVAPTGSGPDAGKQRMGEHLRLAVALGVGDTPQRGLPWIAFSVHLPAPRDLPGGPAWEAFRDGLRDSGLLDPSSYWESSPQWTVVADLPDGRTLIVSQHQELDNPAYVFSVLTRPDGSVETVKREAEIDPESPKVVIVPAPGGQGRVVVAEGKPIAYRTSETGSWVNLGNGAALVPADAVEVKYGET